MQLEKLVYRHRRLDTNAIFYVGMGNKNRPYSTRRNKHWQNIVNKTDYAIEIVADNLTLEDALELEIFLISEYGLNNLTNINSGGEGQFNPDEETRYKLGSGRRGKEFSVETKRKMSEAGIGRKHSEESKLKIKDNHKFSKAVVDLETGIFYDSLLSACNSTNIIYSREYQRIMRYKKNYRFTFI